MIYVIPFERRALIHYTSLLVAVSGKIMVGLNNLASSKPICAYAITIATSPGLNLKAAGPFKQTTPLSRSPSITYVSIRSPLFKFRTCTFSFGIIDENVLRLAWLNSFHQSGIERDATNIVEISLSNGNSVNF